MRARFFNRVVGLAALIAAVSLLTAVLAVPVVLNTILGLALIGFFRVTRRG